MGVVLAELTTPYDAAALLRSQVHDELRWLGAGEAFTVPWLDGDLPVVEALVARMSRP